MIRKFISYYRPHKKLFCIDLLCAFIVAVCNLVYPSLAQQIIQNFAPNRMPAMIIAIAVALLGIYLIKMLLNFVVEYWGHQVGVRIQADMRNDLFAKLQKLPFTYFDEHKSGTIMSRVINDLMDISELAHHGPEDLFLSLVTLIGSFVLMMVTISVPLTLVIFAFIPIFVGFAIFRRKAMNRAFKKMRERTGEINAQIESSIAGIRVTKAYDASNYEIKKFAKSSRDFQSARNEAYKQMGFFFSGMGFFTDFLYLLALVLGGFFLCYEISGFDPATFTGFILYITILIGPIRTLITIFEQIQSGMTGFERFQEVMKEEEEQERENAIALQGFQQEVTFDHVSFHYASSEEESKRVLSHLSFSIPKGKTVALVGPSGGGKTTICHLLPRFYEIDEGAIYIDGTDIRDFTRSSLRQKIGIVAQDVFLFAGSIRENIAYGFEEATLEQIIEAAKKANIHEFIETLQNGYDTYVGERGVKLSGGQKQRISIARAFLKDPDILILDEATSALDNVTEMQIQASLSALSKGRTTLVVAHRLSTVKNADEIIVLTKNGVEEKGTHASLIEKQGIYATLYQYQFKTEL